MSEPAVSTPRRGSPRTVSALIGALVAVVGCVLLIWVLSWVRQGDVANPARTVDYRSALQAARQQAPFHVLAPTPRPEGLRATSVDFEVEGDRTSWHLGFVTGDEQYVGLYESNAPADSFIAESTPADQVGSPVTVAGHTWLVFTSDAGETALVRVTVDATTVVTGTVQESVLTSFVAALH